MNVAIACDHGGLVLKQCLKDVLEKRKYTVLDLGTHTTDSVDYPDYANKLAKVVVSKEADFGIVICGTGIGISIACNKIKGIRCALIHNKETAALCKEHNNANVISMGGRVLSEEQAVECLEAYLDAQFQGGRHQNRLDKISSIENENFK